MLRTSFRERVISPSMAAKLRWSTAPVAPPTVSLPLSIAVTAMLAVPSSLRSSCIKKPICSLT